VKYAAPSAVPIESKRTTAGASEDQANVTPVSASSASLNAAAVATKRAPSAGTLAGWRVTAMRRMAVTTVTNAALRTSPAVAMTLSVPMATIVARPV
jgi:hypothetical protein